MADQAHEWTDEQIEELQKRFRKVYAQAEMEMRQKLADFLEDYDRENKRWKERLRKGEVTQEQYDGWLKDRAIDKTYLSNMVETLASDANNANQLAMDAIRDTIPSIFAENANYATYEVEAKIGRQYHSFDLYDKDTVRILIRDQPDLLPPLPNPRMDNGKDLRWNRQKFAGAITQSILQGESIPHAAERIGRVMRVNETSAIRAARTAITGAENAGRVESYRRARKLGIDIEQQWMATFDQRTRLSHRELHGQHVPVGSYFVARTTTGNRLLFPGDPSAEPSEVYNCRCTLVAWSVEMEEEMGIEEEIWTNFKDGTTYSEWKEGKEHQDDKKKED